MNASNNQKAARNKEIIRRLYEQCFNTGSLELVNQFVSKDYSGIHNEKGPEGFAEIIASLRAGFPDIQWEIQDLIAEGNSVAIRWMWHGTHLGTFRNLPASGKQIADQGIAFYQFNGHEIISASVQTDRLGFLQQIGILPPDFTSNAPVKTNK